MKKKLLVLGIGPAQVDLINAAKEMEFEVYACALNENGPGRHLVDDFRLINITDVDAVEMYAKEKEVDFIYTMALESAINTISVVSERLQLNSFVDMETLNKLNNKYTWRKVLGDIEGNVHSIQGSCLDDFRSWTSFPAIIKPVDGSGQRGVHKVNSFQEVEEVIEHSLSQSKLKLLILEEYVDGPEISVNSFMEKGELKFYVISDRISHENYPGGIIKEHHVPSRIVDASCEVKIKNLVDTVNRIMGLHNGHIYFQLKLENMSPKIIEFTPRFDACHMWRLIYESTNVDLRKAALELLAFGTSETINKIDSKMKAEHVKTIFVSNEPHETFMKKSYVVPEKARYLQWYYEDGEKIKKVTGYLEKVGFYIIQE